MLNVGLDVGLLSNHLTMTFDVFSNKTNDLLLNVSIPASTGFNTVLLNSGSLTNKGIEVAMNYKISSSSNFKWDVSGNLSVLRNEITSLGLKYTFLFEQHERPLGNIWKLGGSWKPDRRMERIQLCWFVPDGC